MMDALRAITFSGAFCSNTVFHATATSGTDRREWSRARSTVSTQENRGPANSMCGVKVIGAKRKD